MRLVTYLAFFLLIFIGCEKESKITKITPQGVFLENENNSQPIAGLGADNTTVFIMVRHAEKVRKEGDDDPDLTSEGIERAKRLSNLLKELNIRRVGYTATKRALQTAQPTIDMATCGSDVYSKTATESFLLNCNEAYKGKVVLVVGHSNTIPEMVNNLIGEKKYTDIPDGDFGDIFIVSVIEKGNARAYRYKY
jgi:2,3-bisphosphoglycerate-dependent phosphoglycerate mutase